MVTVTDKLFSKVRQSRNQCQLAKKLWITGDILKSIKNRNKHFAKFRKSKNENDLRKHKSFGNILTHIKSAAKATFFSKLSKKKVKILL